MELRERFRGCLLGLAVGDAVGTAVEFRPRGSFPPVTDMTGGGPFWLLPGQWTDDTSMALCLATSLVERGAFDVHDQMDRYLRWYREGYLSSTGACFDIGGTVASALGVYGRTGNPYAGSTDPMSAGNGCIMRLAPIPMFFYPDLDAVERYSAESSRTTHGAQECVDACRLFGRMICRALLGLPKDEVVLGDSGCLNGVVRRFSDAVTHLGEAARPFSGAAKIVEIANGAWWDKAETDIRGSGYVVESLEAALWCFVRTETFEDAVLKAANLGDDADTTAAVCGQLAGAYYGESAIPSKWLGRLSMRDEIAWLADQLAARKEAPQR
jgi:ADP-ribosyl-[dinitrogen reductase] hydrolase